MVLSSFVDSDNTIAVRVVSLSSQGHIQSQQQESQHLLVKPLDPHLTISLHRHILQIAVQSDTARTLCISFHESCGSSVRAISQFEWNVPFRVTTAAFAGAAEYVAFAVSAAWCTSSSISTSTALASITARGGGQRKESGEACHPGQ